MFKDQKKKEHVQRPKKKEKK